MKIGNYRFKYHSTIIDESIYYKCRGKDNNNVACKASVTIFDNEIIRTKFDHNHVEVSTLQWQFKATKRSMNVQASTSRTPLQQIYNTKHNELVHNICSNMESDEKKNEILDKVSSEFRDYKKMPIFYPFKNHKSRLTRLGSENQPALPNAIMDINLEGNYTITNTNTKFLIYDNKKARRILVFCSPIELKILKTAKS